MPGFHRFLRDGPVLRGGDLGVAQVQLGLVGLELVGFQSGLQVVERRHGLVEFGFGNGLSHGKAADALVILGSLVQVGLHGGLVGHDLVKGRRVILIVDLGQEFAGLHLVVLIHQNLLDRAADSGG